MQFWGSTGQEDVMGTGGFVEIGIADSCDSDG